MVKCGLCHIELEEEECDEGYHYPVCKKCSRELEHYGSE
jgi:hypothetical protein